MKIDGSTYPKISTEMDVAGFPSIFIFWPMIQQPVIYHGPREEQ